MNSSASTPSTTTCRRAIKPACSNACSNNATSAGLSSTNKISAGTSGIRFRPSESEEKRRALVGLRLGPDAAPVPVNDALHDGQTDTRALKILGAMQPLKHNEKFGRVLHVETGAVVADKINTLMVLGKCADFDA